jgi:hypothetical protein
MEITNSVLEWTTEDVIHWKSFLTTTAGSRLIPKLVEFAPPLLEGGGVNEIMIRNGKVLGFQEAVRALLTLTSVEPDLPKTESAYPSLTADKEWDDGQQTTEENKP